MCLELEGVLAKEVTSLAGCVRLRRLLCCPLLCQNHPRPTLSMCITSHFYEIAHLKYPTRQATPFQCALEEYIKGLPEKKRKRKLIIDCQRRSTNGPITPDAIHDSIKKAEEKSSKRTSKRIIRNALGPVVHALKDYDGIIGTLGRFYSFSIYLSFLTCSIDC